MILSIQWKRICCGDSLVRIATMTNQLTGPYQTQLHLGRRTTPTLAKKLLTTSEFIPLKQALPSPKQIPGWFMNFHIYTCAEFSAKCTIYPVSLWKRNEETLRGYHGGLHKSLNILWSKVLHKEKILHCETIALRFLCRCPSKSEQSNPSKQMSYPIS